jgi:hypothetical protein
MVKIDYPTHPYKIRESEWQKEEIWDDLRKSWVRLTPEEWVRQNFVQYLLQVRLYPASLIAVERMMKLGELSKRFDLLVFDRDGKPWMLVECKAMGERLDERVLWQVLRYNLAIPVKYLVITNGESCYVYIKGAVDFEELAVFPEFTNS